MEMFLLCLLLMLDRIYAENLDETRIVNGLSIVPFLDENRYIRLNMTWKGVSDNRTLVSIMFKNTDDCNPIIDVEEHLIDEDQFLIFPSTDMEHPADYLQNGCRYEIVFVDEIRVGENQTEFYEVPECVADKCRCGRLTDSPYQLTSIANLYKDDYSITWTKNIERNLTIDRVYYHRNSDGSKAYTYVKDKNINYENGGIRLCLPDLYPGATYNVTVVFSDYYSECSYLSSIVLEVPNGKNVTYLFIMGGLVSVPLAVLVLYYNSQGLEGTRKMLTITFCKKTREEHPIVFQGSNAKVETNAQYIPLEFILKSTHYDDFEHPRNRVVLKEVVGNGAFGTVFKAHVYDNGESPRFTVAAVKQLREYAPAEEVQDFLNEISMLKMIGEHENIVKLLGCVTIDEPFLMIMEYISGGSLKDYFKKLRNVWEERKQRTDVSYPSKFERCCSTESEDVFSDSKYLILETASKSYVPVHGNVRTGSHKSDQNSPSSLTSSFFSSRLSSTAGTEITYTDTDEETPCIRPVLSSEELKDFALQIAKGMAHLEKLGIIHRDLAARNVLITNEKKLKLSDFGMSKTQTYVTRGKKCPLRWMSIEAIEQRISNNKTDVWSFGVVLWEIGTLGAFPYEDTPDAMVLHNLKQGIRLERPEICTDELHSLMLKCWQTDPERRPTFKELVNFLDKKQIYLDFDQLNPLYVFPKVVPSAEIQ